MQSISISDMTLKYAGIRDNGIRLSFREKIEIAKLADRLNVSVIEMPPIENAKVDSLLIKSVAMSVKNSAIAVPVQMDKDSISVLWNAVKEAKHPRMQLEAPVSAVQMEFFWHKKNEGMIKAVVERITAMKALCNDVEFVAIDATRAEKDFLCAIIDAAVEAGANRVTLCDTAGLMMADEMAEFVNGVKAGIKAGCEMGICCADALSMADACSIAAARCGVTEIKTIACRGNVTNITNIAAVIKNRGDSLGLAASLRMSEMLRVTGQIENICRANCTEKMMPDSEDAASGLVLTAHDNKETVLHYIESMGYSLNEEDADKVYEAFLSVAEKRESVTSKEIDSIIAAVAMQVPPAYKLKNYVINCGNVVSSSAHIILEKEGVDQQAVSLGDGPIDAALNAIESIIGRHFELDEFQIKAVTEGREAMGETVVRLRSEGKLYSGRGISTDIVDSAVRAYLNAVNKIVYEEEEA